jgi:serine/threonine protein kinase
VLNMAQALPLPEQIGRYQIVSEIGRGSMGRVFLALDPVIDRHVALKVMAPQSDVGSKEWNEMQERFLLEARAAGRLRHPGVVTIFDADRDRETDTSYIAMELIEGQSLQELLLDCSPLKPARALPIIEQVALALHAAHENDLVHRDVKPANILLDAEGTAKLTDFGITKFRTLSLTAAGTVLGSPSYMSPEQVRDDEIDGRTDLFALGVVLYECLSGALPFQGDSLATVTYNILELDPLSSEQVRSSVDPEVLDVVRRAIQKDPARRFQSGYEFAQALRAAQAGSPAPRGPQGTHMLAAGSVGQARSVSSRQKSQRPSEPAKSSKSLGWLLALLVILSLAVGIPTYRSHAPDPVEVLPAKGLPVDSSPAGGLPVSAPQQTGIQAPATATGSPVEVAPEGSSPIANAALAIQYKNRLKAGMISLWVDGNRVWSRSLSAKGGMFKRVSGQSIRGQIPIVPGRHTIEVRITGAEQKVDVSKKIEGVFRESSTRTLQVGLLPTVRKLKLSWKE